MERELSNFRLKQLNFCPHHHHIDHHLDHDHIAYLVLLDRLLLLRLPVLLQPSHTLLPASSDHHHDDDDGDDGDGDDDDDSDDDNGDDDDDDEGD